MTLVKEAPRTGREPGAAARRLRPFTYPGSQTADTQNMGVPRELALGRTNALSTVPYSPTSEAGRINALVPRRTVGSPTHVPGHPAGSFESLRAPLPAPHAVAPVENRILTGQVQTERLAAGEHSVIVRRGNPAPAAENPGRPLGDPIPDAREREAAE